MKKETKSKSNLSSGAGFTLIELLIVIAVIGVLAVALIMVINPFNQLAKANDAKRKSDLAQIQRALQLYYQDNNSYPPSTGSPSYEIINPPTGAVSWGGSWAPYMSTVPKDPSSSSKNYVYYSSATDGYQSYYLYASLDRGNPVAGGSPPDQQACNSGGPGICGSLSTNSISSTACGGTCNFGVTSPNVSP